MRTLSSATRCTHGATPSARAPVCSAVLALETCTWTEERGFQRHFLVRREDEVTGQG